MNIICMFHRWRLYSWNYYTDVSYGRRAPSTEYVLACDKCAKTKDGFIYDAKPTQQMLEVRFNGISQFSKLKEQVMSEERQRALAALNIVHETMSDEEEWTEGEVVDRSLATAQVYAILDLAKAIRENHYNVVIDSTSVTRETSLRGSGA